MEQLGWCQIERVIWCPGQLHDNYRIMALTNFGS